MPVASRTMSRILPSPCGPCDIDVSVQWKTIRFGSQSARSCAEVAISPAISGNGRFQGPATRARATWIPRSLGANRLNCGSLNVLTEGMMSPMRLRGSVSAAASTAVTTFMGGCSPVPIVRS